MKIYIASSWKMKTLCHFASLDLRNKNHEVDLFCEGSKYRTVFSFKEIKYVSENIYNGINIFERYEVQEAFKQDKKWLDWCDMVLLILPSGRSAHLEAGYAKGMGKRLIILGEFPINEYDLMYGFADAMFKWEDWEKLLDFIKNPINK